MKIYSNEIFKKNQTRVLKNFDAKNFLCKFFVAIFLLLIFSSCKNGFDESKKILEGAWAFSKKNYDEAVADFSQSLALAKKNQNPSIEQYALFALASAYLAKNESDLAKEKLNAISSDGPTQVRSAAYYNLGVIFFQNGDYDFASECFKNALLLEPQNLSAKINLEISLLQNEEKSKQGEQSLSGAEEGEENSLLENSIFNTIRESEKQKWKNLQTEEESSAEDY